MNRRLALICPAFVVVAVSTALHAQERPPADEPPAATILPHSDNTWWVSGQINLIEQGHGLFNSAYAGPNSFRAASEHATSRVLTLYTGVRLGHSWEAVFDIESAGGRGLSDALGLAGFTNLDVVRNPTLGAAPYVARAMIRKVIALGYQQVEVHPTQLALASTLPARRLEVRAGKLGIVDFFDVNGIGSDSHLQFTNWTVANNGAYDYAADTRGYTYGIVVEYDTPRWSIRGAEALMPTVANGIVFDWNITQARGENVEVEWHASTALTLRMLAYDNHANMGSYSEAIAAYETRHDPVPNIETHREQGRIKGGVGANVEYATAAALRLFARAGWNSGDTESFAYTEVNDTVAIGGDISGAGWHRRADRLGIAFVSNGLSEPHREYLRLGGLGFLLGDGTLRYGRETIVESYYTAHIWRGVFGSAGAQLLVNPGYNRDRGPAFVHMARLHLDF